MTGALYRPEVGMRIRWEIDWIRSREPIRLRDRMSPLYVPEWGGNTESIRTHPLTRTTACTRVSKNACPIFIIYSISIMFSFTYCIDILTLYLMNVINGGLSRVANRWEGEVDIFLICYFWAYLQQFNFAWFQQIDKQFKADKNIPCFYCFYHKMWIFLLR